MYIINECDASYISRYEKCFLGAEESKLNLGDSFREGIVINYEGTHMYTITALSEVVTDAMTDSEFLALFHTLPSGCCLGRPRASVPS